MNNKKKIVLLTVLLMIRSVPVPSYGAWIQNNGHWRYERGQTYENSTWKLIDNAWFYFDDFGYMVTGWQQIGGRWYFFNPVSDGSKGSMLTGWHWVDGYCYYLAENPDSHYPQGAMYENTRTPDGFRVNSSGAWINGDGIAQYQAGKGIQTAVTKKTVSTGNFSGGGTGGGGGSGHSRSGSKNNAKPQYGNPEEPQKEPATPSNAEQSKPASPSEAKKVSWKLYFVEENNHSNKIFKSQSGQSEEYTELTIDFPETVIGKDRYYYHSLVSSPWSTVVSGTGTQKYYVEFKKGEKLPEEDDPDQEARNRLSQWLDTARKADLAITGEEPLNQQLITKSLEESNERLLNLASMADGSDRKEVYLIAKNHTPATMILSQRILNIKNVSQLIRAEFVIDGDTYTVMRVGFEKTYEEGNCSHSYEVIERVEPTCMNNGYETVRCAKCGKEETVILPATGHTDTDHDGTCDICYQPTDEAPEVVHYSLGDIQARTVGNRIYLFRCIDEDYEDAMGNSQKAALFLCDSVIRSDIMGVSEKFNFGDNNNYKYSKIREWLLNNVFDSLFIHNTYIGITRSYIGSTGKATYEQLNESSLMGFDRLYQSMEDKIFILSVEEALKYRDYLWKFGGSETNNPDSQISAYSKGYYLRTPQNGGLADSWSGEGIYAVSLTDGNIQPVNVSETGIGFRPAITIPQG
ncbi:DUF6273 domain-containing protein [Lacrimispora sp. 38-1]|uniref:DUF6273 domain-containing protein n=1 Tax=Lacrimispora sp. 38-1 TaxID=3125778 RepID=UPI003CF97534